MITEKELLDAIRDCEKDPITPTKREALADLFIIKDHLFPDEERTPRMRHRYSESTEPSNAQSVENLIQTSGDSEFLQTVNGKKPETVWKVLDELLSVIYVTNSALYYGTLRKLNE